MAGLIQCSLRCPQNIETVLGAPMIGTIMFQWRGEMEVEM